MLISRLGDTNEWSWDPMPYPLDQVICEGISVTTQHRIIVYRGFPNRLPKDTPTPMES